MHGERGTEIRDTSDELMELLNHVHVFMTRVSHEDIDLLVLRHVPVQFLFFDFFIQSRLLNACKKLVHANQI